MTIEENDYSFLNPKELTKEKNLWDLFLLYRRIPQTNFTILTTLITAVVAYTFCGLAFPNLNLLNEQIRTISDFVFSYATSVLGFLIAGFTIFISVNNRNLFLDMASVPYDPLRTSYLKYVFGVFIDVFILFMFVTFICFIIKFLGSKGGPASLFFDFFGMDKYFKYMFSSFVLTVLSSLSTLLFVSLQYFIFNVYKIIMMSVRRDYEESQS